MQESILTEHYEKRGFAPALAAAAVESVRRLESHLAASGLTLEAASVGDIRAYVRLLIERGQNDLETLLALARYFYLTGRSDVYIYFTSLLGGLGVYESIQERLRAAVGEPEAARILAGLTPPPLGSDPAEFPAFTRELVNRLETNLPLASVQSVLAGNNHDIPDAAFDEDKALFASSGSMDEFLLAQHRHQVSVLQRHCDTRTVWFEQIITQPVVDFVAANPEVQSAVREGDTLYTTKIPYDPARFLEETDPVKKRYYACHCPFAREAILSGKPEISENWCYCSGGFVKRPYEVLLGRTLKVTLLQSVLRGDPVCRFAIHLEEA